MTYIHPAAELVTRSSMRHVVSSVDEKRTSWPIHTSSSGVLLWDRSEPIVVF